MALINESHTTLNDDSNTSWSDSLKNTRIILHEYDLAIYNLTTGGHQDYTLNSGQSSQRVTRFDLPRLIEMRGLLLSQIADLELLAGERVGIRQVCPYW